MRFAIICLVSLLLVPALGTSGHQRRSSPPPPYREHPPPYLKHPPPPPEQRPPPRPGNFVYYHGPTGPNAGIALASSPDRNGHYAFAPLLPSDHLPPGRLAVHTDKVVKAHPGDIVTSKGKSMPEVASHLTEGHARNPPQVTYASGPIQGSPNYVAEHGGNRRPGGRGSRWRNWFNWKGH
ncbi:hypothetical protein M378DRAFT_24317 [Amanita muscaria Koide BX008]|uniref:Uncharacterized protein n=1 Tax=Amanita muscaria (strain Koide BX008) TaxID=946122 RepID=A0A0C2TDD1_AMAMK|nr:hypothetical protein M378DRAFT_24317 [Amanita muscaria Koide BX008]